MGDDRTLYFGSEHSILFPELKRVAGFHALDMNTGKVKWELTLESDISCSSPVISEEGIVYVATIGGDQKIESGYVYGIKTDSKGPLKGAGSAQFCR